MHNGNISNLLIEDHHLIKKNHIYCLSKLDSRELYQIQITLKGVKVTSQTYYEKCFSNFKLDWKKIYLLPRQVSIDTTLRMFQYKLLHNVLYLKKMLFRFNISQEPYCSFCNLEEETPLHTFYECVYTQNLWVQLQAYLAEKLYLPSLTPQSALF